MTDFTRQGPIGRRLRKMYQDIVNEELPDEFIKLLCDAGLRMELERQQTEHKRQPLSQAEAEKLEKDYRRSRRSQDPIGQRLRQAYATVLNEELPEEFIKLLCEYGMKREASAPAEDEEAARRRQAFEKRVDDLFDEVRREKPDPEQ